jgi:regulation of enolase protein 1 (concanavalin A-like superfamily)
VNAPALLAELPPGDHQLIARARVGFGATFDAGVLLAWVDEDRFAKLCFEYSPAGQPMVVSVVTREVSDDANAYVVDGDEHWLRISTLGPALAFHASSDGERWAMVRYFDLGSDERPRIGLQAQSPTGDGCEVVFSDITHRRERLADLRDGT